MNRKTIAIICAAAFAAANATAQTFTLNDKGYYNHEGVDVMAFNDFYPEGHQGGISIIMNGKRVAANGDIRFEPTPGQWQPVPKQLSREIKDGKIVTTLCYPDSTRHQTGFNPMIYPDINLTYTVTLEPQGDGFMVTVDLDRPVPAELAGRAGFNLEFFPGELFGKPWIMDSQSGIYPQQANSPLIKQKSYVDISVGNFRPEKAPAADINMLRGEGYSPYTADEIIAVPYADGRSFTSRPDDAGSRLTVRTLTENLKLYDGRMNHNNGWFVLRSEIPAGVTKGAVKWYIEPSVVKGWRYGPVIQTSQVGYLSNQPKRAIIETDVRDVPLAAAELVRYEESGESQVVSIPVTQWDGTFLRYKYLIADFSSVTEPGLYRIRYADSESSVFRIGADVLDRGVWQPVVEYFLPVQMCHVRVMDKYRVWHDACHLDDAVMAKPGNLIDGYVQPADNMTHYHAADPVPGLNVGGWHDAGDFDLRVESQSGESYILALAYESFRPEIDVTSISFEKRLVEIHEPDGKNDILQQVENGALTVVNGYLALGRLYRGIITNTLRQYVLLGDAAAMTDGKPGNDDDRWVFTENNPGREMSTAAALAASARVLRGHNDTLSVHCMNIAREIFAESLVSRPAVPVNPRFAGWQNIQKAQTAAELYLTTGEQQYLDFILSHWDDCVNNIGFCGWYLARIEKIMETQRKYRKQCEAFRSALKTYSAQLDSQTEETPYGVPYRPSIWGAGWDIQSFGYRHYFLAKAYPEIFSPEPVMNALNFILGCHPGINQASFAGGVGAESATVGYGLNRADWSYIPGGVVSGTALIRPDFPELLVFPYLWQQVEYVLGGGSSHYMFLVLAVKDLMSGK